MNFIRGFVTFVLLFFFVNYSFSIRINEVMQSNVNGIMDDLNEFPDSWIELYNEDSVPVNIQGYRVGLEHEFESAYILTDSTLIDSAGYYLIYCDKESKGKHTNFRLNSDEDGYLYLFDNSGTIVDSLFIPEMPAPNISYGKVMDNDSVWSYFKNASPEKANEGIYSDYVLSKPDFSVKGGIYKDSFYLHIDIDKKDKDVPNVTIRYTIDGTEPTDSSMEFVDSILINKTMVIRANAFSDSLVSKPSKTQSYIFFDREVTLPIISIAIDSSYLYDDEIGIYVKGKYAESHPDAKSSVPTVGTYNYCFNWRRPVNFEYYVPESKESKINQLCEIRMGGNSSRTIKVKPFVFYANKRFGNKHFDCDFWAWKNGEKKSKSFYLRNGGADWYHAHFRDALVQNSFGKYVDLDWLGCQPTILMINGEYNGVLNIRERAHEDYIWKNYKKLENVDVIEYTSGYAKCGDTDDYKEFYSLYKSPNSTYSELEENMDVNEFLNYFIINSLYSNNDFPGNNYRLWKEKKTGAKWRWFAYDMDQTCGLSPTKEIYKYDFRYLNYILREKPFYDNGYSNKANACVLFQKMMSFPEFKEQYIDRMSVYMGSFVSPSKMESLIDSLVFNVEYEMPFYYEFIKRDFDEYYSEITRLKEWYSLRVPFVYQDMKEFFSLGDTVSMTISTEFPEQLTFNEINVVDNEFSGYYYKDRKFRLSQKIGEDNIWIVSYKSGDSTIVSTFPLTSEISIVIPDSASFVNVENMHYEAPDSPTNVSEFAFSVENSDCQVYLYSIEGKLVSSSIDKYEWNMLPDGLYILVYKNNNGSFAKKTIQKGICNK